MPRTRHLLVHVSYHCLEVYSSDTFTPFVESALEDALQYAMIAEKDFATIELCSSLMDAQYLVSVIFHNMGREEESQEAAQRHFTTVKERRKREAASVDAKTMKVWRLVVDVGAALSSRSAS